jgi:hypothetical protein
VSLRDLFAPPVVRVDVDVRYCLHRPWTLKEMPDDCQSCHVYIVVSYSAAMAVRAPTSFAFTVGVTKVYRSNYEKLISSAC